MTSYHTPPGSSRNVNIAQFLFAHSGTYTNNYRRSYAPHMTSQQHQTIIDHIGSSKSHSMSIGSAQLAKLTPGMMTLSAPTAQDQVFVPNGWDTGRLVFVLTMEVTNALGMTHTYTINGFSDHADLSYSGQIDPQTVLTINSVSVSQSIPGVTRVGGGGYSGPQMATVGSASAFSHGSLNAASGQNIQHYGMRPYDMFSEASSKMVVEGAGPNTTVIDPRTQIGNESASFSSKTNNVATQFLSKSINSMIYAANQTEASQDSDLIASQSQETHVLDAAAHASRDDNTMLTELFAALDRKVGNVNTYCVFKFGDLVRMDPSLTDDRLVRVEESSSSLIHLPRAGEFEQWSSQTIEASVAAQVSVSLNAMMTIMGVMAFAFTADNTTAGHITQFDHGNSGWNTAIMNVATFNPMQDKILLGKRLMQRVEAELLTDVSKGGQLRLQLIVDASALRNTNVRISVNGGPMTPFSLPSFADTLLSPVITNNQTKQRAMAHSIENLTTDITQALNVNAVVANAAQQGNWQSNGGHAPPPSPTLPQFAPGFDPFGHQNNRGAPVMADLYGMPGMGGFGGNPGNTQGGLL